MKTCLILGAGGFMGKALCWRFSGKYSIIAYDKYCPEELDKIDGIQTVKGDFVNTEDFSDLLKGVDVVIHLISTTVPTEGTGNIYKELDENIRPTIRLLESMAKCGTPEIIFSSSGGTVYGDTGERINNIGSPLNPICSYGLQKELIESCIAFYARVYKFNYKIMRIANPYGVGQDAAKPQGIIPIFIRKLYIGEKITVFGDGKNVRDYIYLDDLLNAFEAVLAYSGGHHMFNIGTGVVHSLESVIGLIEELSELKFSGIDVLPVRQCDVFKSLLDVKTSWKELGWEPKVDLTDGILRILQCYKEYQKLQIRLSALFSN